MRGGCENVVLVGARHLTLMRHYPESSQCLRSASWPCCRPRPTWCWSKAINGAISPSSRSIGPPTASRRSGATYPVVAVATDAPAEAATQTALPVLDLADPDAIYHWIRTALISL